MIPDLDLQQLRMFFALVQEGSFTRAAKRVGRTQSAVSHAIRKLEDSAGVKLVASRGRGFKLTDEGQRLYTACETAFYALDSATEEISRRKGRSLGMIRLGATVEFGCSILMKHMRSFLLGHPEIDIEFHMYHELLSLLQSDELDIIIDCKEHHLPELERIILFRESYEVVCSPTFQKEHKIKTYEDLERCPILSLDRDGSWWRRFILSIPSMQRPSLDNLIFISHIRAIIIAAKNSIGVALVPGYSILSEINEGSLLPLFPNLRLMEDRFSIYQKRSRSSLVRHQMLVGYLKEIKPAELG